MKRKVAAHSLLPLHKAGSSSAFLKRSPRIDPLIPMETLDPLDPVEILGRKAEASTVKKIRNKYTSYFSSFSAFWDPELSSIILQ